MNETAYKKVCIFHGGMRLDLDMVVENERRWTDGKEYSDQGSKG